MEFTIFDEKNNRIGTVESHNLTKALDRGYKLHNAGENIQIIDPKTGRIGIVGSDNLSKALKKGYQLDPVTNLDRAQAFAQGAGINLGKIVDTGVAAGSHLLSKSPLYKGVRGLANLAGVGENLPSSEQLQNQASDYWKNPKVEQLANDALDTGKNYDSSIRASKAAGEFVGDIPVLKAVSVPFKAIQIANKTGKFVKAPFIDKINNFLEIPLNNPKTAAKTIAGFAGAGAGGELLKSDNPQTGDLENISREILGNILGATVSQNLPNTTIKAIKSVSNTLMHPVEALKDFGFTAATLPFRGKVNQKVYEKAKKLGVNLTPSMLTDSKLAKYLENNIFESVLSAKAYDDTIKNISPDILKTIDKKLTASVGKKIQSTENKSAASIVSKNVAEQLQENKKIWKNKSDELFDLSTEKLTSNDRISIPKTVDAINKSIDILIEGITDAEGTEKKVLDHLKYLKDVFSDSKHPIKGLIKEQQRLLKKGKYGDVRGYENFYNNIGGTLIDELSNYTANKSFHENYGIARAYYKNNIENGVRNSITKSILSTKSPKQAIKFMDSENNIEVLEKLLGNSEKGIELMSSLKRAKIQQILEQNNVMTVNGDFNPNGFLRLFSRENKEGLLKPLMGGPAYSYLQKNINPVAQAILNSKKELNNPSGSAKTIFQYGVFAGVSNFVGLAKSAGLYASIYSLSYAMSKPKFVEKLISRANSPKFSTKIKNTSTKIKNTINEIPENPAVKSILLEKTPQLLHKVSDNPLMDQYMDQYNQNNQNN